MVSAIDFVITKKDFMTDNIFINFITNEEYRGVLSLSSFKDIVLSQLQRLYSNEWEKVCKSYTFKEVVMAFLIPTHGWKD